MARFIEAGHPGGIEVGRDRSDDRDVERVVAPSRRRQCIDVAAGTCPARFSR